MAQDKKKNRRDRIESAAFEVLEEMGFRKASMLQIAKRSQASNETLYNWYGNKQALFSSIIKNNAEVLKSVLKEALSEPGELTRSLENIGRLLLQFTATEKAIIINRAAVADVTDTGLLATAIEDHARKVMLGLLTELFGELERNGQLDFKSSPEQAVNIYINLLMGELQIQQALGSMPALTDGEIAERAALAASLFRKLYGPD